MRRLWGMTDLRQLVREKLRSGDLPKNCAQVWGGLGTDTPCRGCCVPTRVCGMEFECVGRDGTAVVMCQPCFFVWMQETGL